jgi:hypothetical protein
MVKLHKASEAITAQSDNSQTNKPSATVSSQAAITKSEKPRQPEQLPQPPPAEVVVVSEAPARQKDAAANQQRPARQSTRRQTTTATDSNTVTRPRKADWHGSGLDSPVTRLPGIKDAMATKLAKLGVETVGDFLSLYPRRYDDYRSLKTISQLELGEDVTIIAQVWETRKQETHNRNLTMIKSLLTDGTATIEVTWFNQQWLLAKLKPGVQIVLSGKVEQYLGRLTFNSPEWEELDKEMIHTGRLVPVYPLTKGVSARWLRNRIKSAVDYWAERLPDYMTEHTRQRLTDAFAAGSACSRFIFQMAGTAWKLPGVGWLSTNC